MNTILTELTISLSEFKKNPSKAVREAGKQPLAVLSHNRPAFYMVEPSLFEALVEQIIDSEFKHLLLERLKQRAQAIEVDIDQI